MSSDDPELDDYMIVQVDKPGDFSTYTLRLVGLPEHRPALRPRGLLLQGQLPQ